MIRSLVPFAAAFLLLPASLPSPGQGGAEAPVPLLDLAARHPFLDELSVWSQHLVQPEGKPIDLRRRGVYPVGNGRVFAHLGLGRRANTMQGISGPSYQTAAVWAPDGHFGSWTLELVEDGRRLALPGQSLWRTRGVACVVTEDSTLPPGKEGALTLATVNFAPPGRDALLRLVEVHNETGSPHRLVLRTLLPKGRAAGDRLTAFDPGKGFEAELYATRPARAQAGRLDIDLGEVPAGGSVSLGLALRTRVKGAAYRFDARDAQAFERELDRCRDSWRKRLAGTTTINAERRDLVDLLEDWKVLMLVQRAEPSGAVAPMVHYRGVWIRDSVGPVLAFLRYGLFDEARDILDYLAAAMLTTGELRNHYPLDLDVAEAKKRWLAGKADWSKVRFPGVELPAWIVLMNEWYYRATWDRDHLRRAWPLLEACVEAMKPAPDGTFPTYGDETYLHGAFFSLFPSRIDHRAFLPADAPGRRARSFDNSMLYLLSLNTLGELAEDLDRWQAGVKASNQKWVSKRKAAFEERHVAYLQRMEKAFWLPDEKRFAPFLSPITGRPHRAPYGAVNLKVQWIGYTYALGEKNRQNLKYTLRALWHRGARVGMTPTCGYATGHLQGYLLYSLCDLEDRRRNDALEELLALAKPAGEWAELYDPEGRPIGGYDPQHPNRLRPWESGVNIDAIFFALNGIRYVCSPGWSKKDQRFKFRLPYRCRWLTIKRVRHDGHLFHIFLDRVQKVDPKKGRGAKPEPHLRFRVQYERINEDAGGIPYIDAAVNVGETVFVRNANLEIPINETAAWPVDKGKFFPRQDGPGKFAPVLPPVPAGATTLLLATRPLPSTPRNTFVLDLGRPMTPDQLAALVLRGIDASGKPHFPELVLGLDAEAGTRATFKDAGFWRAPALADALARYAQAGGRILRHRLLAGYEIAGPFPAEGGLAALEAALPQAKAWRPLAGDARDLLRAVPRGTKPPYQLLLKTKVTCRSGAEAVLKLGSDDGVRVFLNGEEVFRRQAARALALDQDEVLVRLRAGTNEFLFQVVNLGGGAGLAARLTTVGGLPFPAR